MSDKFSRLATVYALNALLAIYIAVGFALLAKLSFLHASIVNPCVGLVYIRVLTRFDLIYTLEYMVYTKLYSRVLTSLTMCTGCDTSSGNGTGIRRDA